MTHAHLKIVVLAALPLVLAPGCARNQADTARPASSGTSYAQERFERIHGFDRLERGCGGRQHHGAGLSECRHIRPAACAADGPFTAG